jgi:hypothetical protein
LKRNLKGDRRADQEKADFFAGLHFSGLIAETCFSLKKQNE